MNIRQMKSFSGGAVSRRAHADEEYGLISETASMLLFSDNPEQIIEKICVRLMDFLGCQVFLNYLETEDGEKFYLNSSRGFSTGQAERAAGLHPETFLS